MSKLVFKIVEIPEGHSRRELELEEDDLELTPYAFKGGHVELEFYRTLHFIQVDIEIKADVELECDRSLELFIYPVEAGYEVIFKVDVKEETEDEHGAVRRFNFSSNTLSIEDEVRDTILLNIPMQALHPRFLDEEGNPKDFQTKTFGETGENENDNEEIDPRWDELKKLKN
jgi:uncharacterized metal-binding protein YceD (DUF177 family)